VEQKVIKVFSDRLPISTRLKDSNKAHKPDKERFAEFIDNNGKLASCLETQSTAFPQVRFTLCKNCSKHFFFQRKFNADRKLRYVEKKFAKTGLISFVFGE
jgi:hypothetical protein